MDHTTLPCRFVLDLPNWAPDELQQLPQFLPDLKARMAAVLRFARLNTENQTGGPFAAGVFERDSGRLMSIGVNRVVPLNCSSAHAEVMALSLAQQRLGVYDLGGPGLPAHQLVVNWSPCAMCFGAVLWSGIRSLVIAGADAAMMAITSFDEGPMPDKWREELAKRGIELIEGVLRQEALADFRTFAASNPVVYNGRQG
ncbi:nucleoside deaminase [uncultured Desulfobulbus sp.]|uniref:nucleoside deaminase n=1 Tax=uncultured Desulfobulbus sp. TaxID=239745 RepID=UPI0029C6A801|nr:nucleoside deaminase [uncultured Desulfobulbus sp.]